MRLWSIHPRYLDSKGLVALWREGLLARHVLLGKTQGYRNHPQLIRFKLHKEPVAALDEYLQEVLLEAKKRGYQFSSSKINDTGKSKDRLSVTNSQIAYESEHLRKKLAIRDPERLNMHADAKVFDPHPMFYIVEGDIESWEVITKKSKETPLR